MTASLDHLFVLVGDLDRSVAFYKRLGFRANRWNGYVRLAGGDGIWFGMEQGEPRVGTTIELVIRVDDVDAAFRGLREEGVTFEGEPADQEWGARHVWLRDPDGNRISLFTPIAGPA